MKKQAICNSSYKANTHPWSSIFGDTIFYAFVEIQMAVLKNKQKKPPKQNNKKNKPKQKKTTKPLAYCICFEYISYTTQSKVAQNHVGEDL